MRTSSVVVACALVAASLFLGGCREEEQERILRYQKGTYLGKSDTPLSEETREALRLRTRFQTQP